MIIKIILILILLILSALTSGSEVAFFALDKTRLSSDAGSKLIDKIQKLLDKPQRLLATILISNNFINIAIVILFASIDNPYLESLNSPIIETLIEVGVIGVLILFIGDILPKIYANRKPLVFSKIMVIPIFFLDRYVLFLLNNPMGKSMSFLVSYLSINSKQLSVDELSQALDLTDSNETTVEEKKILKGIVNFGNLETRQIMCPRVDMFAVKKNTNISNIIEKVINKGFSRVPVYENTMDKIIGVLYVKDLLPFLEKQDFNWNELLRDPLYVPENKKLDDLLNEFKSKKIHMAIVVDEYGGTSGLITLEDVMEEIFGELNDEFDQDDSLFSKLDDNTYIFDAKINLQDFYKAIDLKDFSSFEEISAEIETLGGLLIEKAQRIPRVGQVITHQDFKFVIEIVDKKRIRQVKVILTNK
ncbi:MAG TPA: gliding motility-associated protein GldE [Flavobacteriaceae bacterium]|nr:gliding motility-associated protein GldE [Flavobacteriaceae bacterium]